jgi:outer membrane protein assembly factor BamB
MKPMARRIPFRASLLVFGLPLVCPAAETGRPAVLWDRPLEGDVYGSALAGDTVVLLTLKPGANEWTIEGRRADTGERAWQGVAPGTSLGPEVKGAIIVSGRDGIRALDAATGKERWRFTRPVAETNKNDGALGGFSSPAILDGECLYAADFVPHPEKKDAVGVSTFYCLGPEDGKLRWSAAIPTGTIGPSLASNRDSVIVVREYGASAVDKATRRVRWSIDFNSTRAPAALSADAAYLPGHGLRAVSLKDGSTLWERHGAPAAFGPTLQDGVLYAPLAQPVEEVAVVPGEALGHLRHLPQYAPTYVALDPLSGRELWERVFPNEVRAGAHSGDRIHLVCWDGHLYSLDRRDGKTRSKLPLDFDDWAPTPLVWKGRLILAFKRRLVAVGEAKGAR